RDRNGAGGQTCALPIYLLRDRGEGRGNRRHRSGPDAVARAGPAHPVTVGGMEARAEERSPHRTAHRGQAVEALRRGPILLRSQPDRKTVVEEMRAFVKR